MSFAFLMSRADFIAEFLHGNDLVVLAVDQQRRDVEALEVFGEVGLGEATVTHSYEFLSPDCMLHEPELVEHALRDLVPGPVRAVELDGEVPVELRAVGGERRRGVRRTPRPAGRRGCASDLHA